MTDASKPPPDQPAINAISAPAEQVGLPAAPFFVAQRLIYLPSINNEKVYSISGLVTDQNAKPVAGIVVKTDSGVSATTGSNGVYTLADIKAGNVTLTPQVTNRYYFNPVSSPILLAANISGVNFSALPGSGEYILNGGFEDMSGWEISTTAFLAAYTSRDRHTGLQSMQGGIFTGTANGAGYSKFRQMVSIPNNVKSAQLTFWMNPSSTDTANKDAQYVYISDMDGNTLDTVVASQQRNDRTWIKYQIDLSKYAGQSIKIVFAVYNDGSGGITGMLIDDVSLMVTP
jgi:hypothetical protein